MNRTYLLAASTAAALLAAAAPAMAQDVPAGIPTHRGYEANVFQPSERGSDWNSNESLDLRGNFRFAIGVIADHEYRSVIPNYNASGSVGASALRDQFLLHPGISLIFANRFRLAASLPISVYEGGHPAPYNGTFYLPPKNDASTGDFRLALDIRLLGEYGDAFTLAVGAQGFASTGNRDDYTGDGVWRVSPRIMIAGDIGLFAYALKAQYDYNPYIDNFAAIRVGSDLRAEAAAGVRLFDKHLLIGPEAIGYTMTTSSFFDERATPVEIMASANINLFDQVHIKGGYGTFLNKGYGAPVSMGTLGLEYAPGVKKSDRDGDGILDDDDACPDTAGIHTDDPKTNGCPPPPPPDRDGDGVPDASDACPDVAGVATNDPKTNGCPPDRDGDGIPDAVDACPDKPGVKSDDPKKNGCPGDRDNDGVTDDVDACPDTPGVATADPKTNGCPDTDRDKDGIPNDVDACPDQAGPKSDDPKTNGCPRVFIKGGNIQILEQPKFDFNKAVIKPESDSLLTEVAKVMTDHPEIKYVEVAGYTDNKGSAAINKTLSQKRAQAVAVWLEKHGIDKARVGSIGKGMADPIDTNATDAGRANNRRVEFHILDQAPTTKEFARTKTGEAVPVKKAATPKAAPAPKKP